MPLYECAVCHCIDNTAMGNFWDHLRRGRKQLCTECDPLIAKWHGQFPKISIDEYRFRFPDGHIAYPARPKVAP